MKRAASVANGRINVESIESFIKSKNLFGFGEVCKVLNVQIRRTVGEALIVRLRNYSFNVIAIYWRDYAFSIFYREQ